MKEYRRLTFRMRSVASGETESGMRRSTLQILRYVAATGMRRGKGVRSETYRVDRSGLRRVVFRPGIRKSGRREPNSRLFQNVPSPQSSQGVDSLMSHT